MKRLQPLFRRLQAYVERPWYEPVLSLLALIDTFVVVIPTDGILVSSTLLCGQKWWRLALWTTVGSSLGGLALAFVVQDFGLPILNQFFGDLTHSAGWIWTEKLFEAHGLWVLFLVAATPVMQQPALILAVMAHHSLSQIFVIMIAGRLIKYLLIAYIARYTPALLERIWGFRRELHEMDDSP